MNELSDGLTTYSDRAVFEDLFPGLVVEDFETANVSPLEGKACSAPVDEATSNGCFLPGDIASGVQIVDRPGPGQMGLAVVGRGFYSQPSKLLHSNIPDDRLDIFFDPPVTAAAMDLLAVNAGGLASDTFTVRVFDAENVELVNTPVEVAGIDTFWGISSKTPIANIRFRSPVLNAEAVDNIQFAGTPRIAISNIGITDLCGSDPGQQDGLLEPGETLEVTVEVGAFVDTFTGITGTLTSLSPDVTVLRGASDWPNLDSGDRAVGNLPFLVRLEPGLTCFSELELELVISSGEAAPLVTNLSRPVGQSLAVDLPVVIPDSDSDGTTSELLVVADQPLADVDVRVEIEHTFVRDLQIALRGPDGTTVTLLDRPNCSDDNMEVTFDDDASTDLSSHCEGTDPWYQGDASPEDPLSVFNGMSSRGTWTLVVSDRASADLGSLIDWQLITDPPLKVECDGCLPLEADLGLVKTSNAPGPLAPGDPLIYNLEVTNQGPGVAYSVLVMDELPGNLLYDSNDCGGDLIDQSFSWSFPELAPGASVGCRLHMSVPDDAETTEIVNTAHVSGLEPDENSANDSGSEIVAVRGMTDLQLRKTSDAEGVLEPGDELTFTLSVINNGPGRGTSIVVTDELPAELTYLFDDCDGTLAQGTFTWEIPLLEATVTAECRLVMLVTPDTPTGEIVNTAQVESAEIDPISANDSDVSTVEVLNQAVVEVPALSRAGWWLLAMTLAWIGLVTLRRSAT